VRILQLLLCLYLFCFADHLVDATKKVAAEEKDAEKKDATGKKDILDMPGKKDAVDNDNATEKSEFKGAWMSIPCSSPKSKILP